MILRCKECNRHKVIFCRMMCCGCYYKTYRKKKKKVRYGALEYPLVLACFVVLSWPVIGQCDDARRLTLGEYDAVRNSNARYERTSRRHHVRSRTRHRSDDVQRSTSIYEPDLSSPPAMVKGSFEERRPAIRYPYTTGTSILDAFEGRRPAIDDNSCLSPVRDLQYLTALDAMARY